VGHARRCYRLGLHVDNKPRHPGSSGPTARGGPIGTFRPARLIPRTGDEPLRIERRGLSAGGWDLYHAVLTLPWPFFLGGVVAGYLGINLLFALLYLAGGDVIANAEPGSFWDAYMFSVQTLATIGYGSMSPKTPYADVLVAIEAFTGLFGVAVATSLMFTRFARPSARVLFARSAIVTYRDGAPALMLRMANERGNPVVDAQVRVVIARNEVTAEGESVRRFHDVALTRTFSPLFALSWTVVHPIDAASPIFGATPESLAKEAAELMVFVAGIDDTFQTQIHARFSYLAHEIVWDRRFRDVISVAPDGERIIDYGLFHELEALPPHVPRVLPWPPRSDAPPPG
jgi:inward rectifier potassium channel